MFPAVMAGDELQVGVPCGVFKLCPATAAKQGRPLVFLAAGVGVTPLMSMMQALVDGDEVDPGSVTFVQCCRSEEHQPMKADVAVLKDKGIK